MRLAWLAAALSLVAPAAAHAGAQTRWVCANQAVLDQGPGSHPFDDLERGDRFVADRFARHGVWAHGTPVRYSLSRRPVVRHRAEWIRVADLCRRGSVPWSALPPANAAGSFLGLRMAAGPGGRLYVGSLRDAVNVYSAGGRLVRSFGHRGNGSGQLHQVLAIAPGPAGDVFVTDTVGHVTHFSPGGSVLAQWGGRSSAAGGITTPVAAVVDRDGDVDVLDETAKGVRVKRFSPDGTLLGQWSPAGGLAEQLALAPDGNLVIAGNDGRVRVTTVDGQPVRDFADGSSGRGIRALAVEPGGGVYVLGDRLGAFGLDGARVGVSKVGQAYSH